MITENQIQAALRKAAKEGTRANLHDDGERGAGRLAMSVRAHKGRVSSEWYAVFYRDNKRRSTKLGSYPALSLADARRKFREDYAPAISAGGEVAQSHFSKRSRHGPQVATVKALFEAYVASLEAADIRSASSIRHILLSSSVGADKEIGADKLAAVVKPSDITPLLSKIHARGAVVMAAQTRAYISAAFSFGIKSANDYTNTSEVTDWGIIANPVSAIPADSAAHRAGNRFLTPKEFRTFWEWLIDFDVVSKLSPACRLQMTTGQRVEEILRISDKVYDASEKMLNWDKTKNGLAHSIPLSQHSIDILGALRPNGCGLYFPNQYDPKKPATYSGPNKIITRFIEETGAPHFTARDTRRSWKTLAGRAGVSKADRDTLQNHAKGDISSKHYDRYDYLPEKRAAVEVWESYLTRILAGEFDDAKPAEITSIDAAKAA